MIDLKNGSLFIDGKREFGIGYTFSQFKRSKYFKNQDGIRLISLEEPHIINGRKYIIIFFFRDDIIYMISLINCDKQFSESEEYKRKEVHDLILLEEGIDENRLYDWGKIASEYDAKGNISSINVYYNRL